MFFVRFIPTFPVLHRATFVFRDNTHPLLLNAIAIGSLYLGPKNAIKKVRSFCTTEFVSVLTILIGRSVVAAGTYRSDNLGRYPIVQCMKL